MPEPLSDVLTRIEAAIVEGVRSPPVAEFGYALVKISDLRRLIEATKRG